MKTHSAFPTHSWIRRNGEERRVMHRERQPEGGRQGAVRYWKRSIICIKDPTMSRLAMA